MSGFELKVTLDSASLGRIKTFENYEPTLEEWLVIAERQSLQDLKSVSNRNAYDRFKHSSGKLESRFRQPLYSTHLPVISGAVTNDAPYSQRRNYGFSGRTDALGRYYPNDPGAYYMTDAASSELDWIKNKFAQALNKAASELAQGGSGQ